LDAEHLFTSPADASRRTASLAALAVAVAYLIGVEIGFIFTLSPSAVSLLWPPNAIVLAALLLTPPRIWGWLLLAVLPVHLYAQLGSGVPLTMSLCWYVSNVMEALLGAALIQIVLKRTPNFGVLRDLAVFLGSAVIVAPLVTSFVDAGFVASVEWRYDGDYWKVWRTRLFSNAVATSIIVPLIVAFVSTPARGYLQWIRNCGAEAVVLFAVLGTLSWFVFHTPYAIGEGATYLYAPLPLIVWAAVRLGAGGVAACIGIVAFTSIAGELRGLGPFARAAQVDAVFWLQIFLLIAAGSLMFLSATLAELKAARAAALRSKDRLDLALRAAHMGVWDWNLATDQVSWRCRSDNHRGVARLPDVLALVHDDDRAFVKSSIRLVSLGQGNCELECRFDGPGGTRWMMVKGNNLRDHGDPNRVSGIFMDTTDRKLQAAAEESQRHQLARLSRMTMLGELSGAIAHELRQPLAAMLFNAQSGLRELTKPAPNPTELTAILEDIVADDTRAAEVITRLRALFVRGVVRSEPVQVRECVQSVLALQHSDLINRNVAVELDLEIGSVVRVDPIQLQQVLLNLVVNACEAMAVVEPATRRLWISSRRDADEVCITVRDTGPGLSNPDKVFEPFFSTKADSLGLGLGISRTIVAAHGGRLWGVNDSRGGAAFHISLPCSEMHATAATDQEGRTGL
jgi:two-component system, LuxR family, sensor kinase FixL